MSNGSSSGGPRQPNRRTAKGSLDGLRSLGEQKDQPKRSRRVANEEGLTALGSSRRSRTSPQGPKTPRPRRRRRIVLVLSLVLIVLLGFVGGSYLYARYRFNQIQKFNVASEAARVSGQPFNVLVIGSDSRSGLTGQVAAQAGSAATTPGQRSDVDMIVHVDPSTKKITILSIPRDTMITAPPTLAAQVGKFNRINTAYGSGPELLVQTIEDNFGIPINHVVQVNFSGFIGATNALGGVWLDFPYPAKDAYSGLNITTPGCQLVSGEQALATARSRHYYYFANGQWNYDGTSDFGRIQRQDAFLKALVNSAKSKYNPLTINAFLGAIPQGVQIDSKFSLNELIGLAIDFHSLDPNSIVTETLPTTSVGYVSPWGDVLFADQPAAQQMLVATFGSQLTTPATPPPNTSLETPQPPVITPTTQPPTTAAPSGNATPSATTPQAAAPPSFDPVPCAGK
jgi:LCP family protein required for cell wall assembly